MAQKFMYIVAGIMALVILALVVLNLVWEDAMQTALIPDHPFTAKDAPPAPDYSHPESWAVRPGAMGDAELAPAGITDKASITADVFFIHPTSHLSPLAWNAAIDADVPKDFVDGAILRYVASALNAADALYAPYYRQATVGAFLERSDSADAAINLAYSDVLQAFDHFIRNEYRGGPLVMAGHSQGSRHLMHLLADRVAGTPLAGKLVVAYVAGWPVSVENDMAALPGIGICEAPEQTGCVASWQTFGPDADPSESIIAALFTRFPGLNGEMNEGAERLCVNPLTWRRDSVAGAEQHAGSLPPTQFDGPLPEPAPRTVSATCTADGFLQVTEPPGGAFEFYILPGSDYHYYDYPLFYMDIRENLKTRVHAFTTAAGETP